MKLSIFSADNTEKGKMELPVQFTEEIRPDLIRRAVIAIKCNKRQPYGSDIWAGMKASAKLSRRRRNYRGGYGTGISRVPRKILSRRGTRFNWQAAVAPGTVKGRQAHPPKADKIWSVKMNKRERRKAIRSAISATLIKEVVAANGHTLPDKYPFFADSWIESLTKTSEVIDMLTKLGFANEIERTSEKKIRAGMGKGRGRPYKTKTGLLIVVSGECSLENAAANIQGFDVIRVDKLNAEALSHDVIPGRVALFTEKAVERLAKEGLFTDNQKKTAVQKAGKKQ
jgi:large subunit ribosomal protein L4e